MDQEQIFEKLDRYYELKEEHARISQELSSALSELLEFNLSLGYIRNDPRMAEPYDHLPPATIRHFDKYKKFIEMCQTPKVNWKDEPRTNTEVN